MKYLGKIQDDNDLVTKKYLDEAIETKADISDIPDVTQFATKMELTTEVIILDAEISNKIDKETGKGLSANDYTTAEKNKLAGIAAGAEVNVQANWNQTNTSADDYIKNKPTIPINAVTTTGTMTSGHVVTSNGETVIKDSGFTIGASVPNNAKFTDTTYNDATTSTHGLMSTSDKSKLNNIANYIVEQGTSSNWNYVKYNDGTMKMWRTVDTTFPSWTSWQGWYYGKKAITFGQTFTSAPLVNATCNGANWAFPLVQDITKTGFNLFGLRPNSSTTTGYFYYAVEAIGKWK